MRDQIVVVTGGSGTFGSAFIVHALTAGVARVICLSRGEQRQAELQRQIPDPRLECWLGDVRDRDRIRKAFRVKPDVVIHAAALKRVEKCEAEPEEAHKTNVLGTLNVVNEALDADVPRVLVISSDKACSPETVYGATKAEAEAQALAMNGHRGASPTRISVVRYGNVLGSNGSFLEQLLRSRASGGPLPITDPEATRFWWAVDDAVVFVAKVLDRMQGAEVWIPKIASARVVDLARAVAPRSSVVVTGMRGPEKLHESMVNATEARYAYELPDCYVLLPKQGQWWSPQPPEGAVSVPAGFTYASNGDPLPVSLEPLEGPCVSPS